MSNNIPKPINSHTISYKDHQRLQKFKVDAFGTKIVFKSFILRFLRAVFSNRQTYEII